MCADVFHIASITQFHIHTEICKKLSATQGFLWLQDICTETPEAGRIASERRPANGRARRHNIMSLGTEDASIQCVQLSKYNINLLLRICASTTFHPAPETILRLKKYNMAETCFKCFHNIWGFHFGENKNLCTHRFF